MSREHYEAQAKLALFDEMREALRYWQPKQMPFPDARRDVICEIHNIRWETARDLLARADAMAEQWGKSMTNSDVAALVKRLRDACDLLAMGHTADTPALCAIDEAADALEATVEWPDEPSEAVADSVRGVLQVLRGKPGATFANVRLHCQLRDDDIDLWPQWARESDSYVTEEGAARLLSAIMRAAHLAEKEGK